MKILLLAPGSNPKIVTDSLIGYSLANALANMHQVTLVICERDEEAVRQANGGFESIVSIRSPWMDRFYNWVFRYIFKEDRGNLLWTAVRYPKTIVFEWQAWRRSKKRIRRGEYDVVLRITPVVPVMPSAIAFFMRNISTPFIIGPLNGGVPWPAGFSQIARQRASAGNWAASLRGLYRYLPFAKSTYKRAKAIIVGSSHTYAELYRFREKLFYMPGENGISSSIIEDRISQTIPSDKLVLAYVGRLVPYKACDLAILGAAQLLKAERAEMTIIGDGPDKRRLKALAKELKIDKMVSFLGEISHAEVLEKLSKADVLLFPSLREFGGGVIFEALAKGAVPVVADYGGPGDIVQDEFGYRIPLTDEDLMVEEIAAALERLVSDRANLENLRRNGNAFARASLTWERKAQLITDILLWATGSIPQPRMLPPKLFNSLAGLRSLTD